MPAYRIVALMEQTLSSACFSCLENDSFSFTPSAQLADAEGCPVSIPFTVAAGQLTVASAQREVFYLDGDRVQGSRAVPDGAHMVAAFPDGRMLHLFAHALGGAVMARYAFAQGETVIVGSGGDSQLCYRSGVVSKQHISLHSLSATQAELRDISSNGYVYVRGCRTSHAVLDVGDVIFVMGLTIVFGGSFLAVSGPAPMISSSLPPYLPPQSGTPAAVEMPASIRFVRSPRILKPLDTREVAIDPPPPCQLGQKLPLLYQLGPSMTMAMGMLINVGFNVGNALSQGRGLSSLGGSIGMSMTMLASAVLWPTLNRRFHKKRLEEDEQHRLQRYSAYIQGRISELRDCAERNRAIRLGSLPDPAQLLERAETLDRRLWERMPGDEDFLCVRLGLGSIPSDVTVKVPEERFSLTDDPLQFEARRVYDLFRETPDMPIPLSLREHSVVGAFGEEDALLELAGALAAQLAVQHSYDDVKLVFILPRAYARRMGWVKLLPHAWSTDRSIRFVGVTAEEIHEVFVHIDKLLAERHADREQASAPLPHFVFFIFDPQAASDEPLMRLLTLPHNGLGLSCLFLHPSVKALPPECTVMIQCGKAPCVYDRENRGRGLVSFVPDRFPEDGCIRLSEALCPIHVKTHSTLSESIPDSLSFLDMYAVSRVERLNVLSRWRENRAIRSISAPIGVRAGGDLFSLNLHEKFHGPHGLVAGMTGSGKSEFLQTMILSLAVNYHPGEVSFVLIDYKGGGMANVFDGMPHLAGKITDLGGNQIQRSLLSIKAEAGKRKRIFSELHIQNINDYHKLYYDRKVAEPLPHLIIISDEFAELKSMQSEFMRELVSTARIGRTLGIHLILATQKPAGIVDEQIWANSNFRVCLKVLDRQDSNEMLKRTEAASITLPGRCYVQVGYNEIFEYVQSGYSGAPYQPAEEYVDPQTQTVTMIDSAAQPLRRAVNMPPVSKNAQSQLQAIVAHLQQLGQAARIAPYRLWLPPLGERLPLRALPDYQRAVSFDGAQWRPCSENQWMRIPVGLSDDPSVQQQRTLCLDFAHDGHALLYGAPTTGKTTFVQTLVYSLAMTHSPDDCLIDVFDFGGRSLRYCRRLPHCRDSVFFPDDEAAIRETLSGLTDELDRRRLLFAESDVGSILAYRQLNASPMPARLLIIDNYSTMHERFSELEGTLAAIAREGANYGIYMLITASSVSAVNYRVTDYFKRVLSLQLNERSDYQSLFGRIEGILPEAVKGRGLVREQGRLVEYQTALAADDDSEALRIQHIRESFEALSACWDRQSPGWRRPTASRTDAPPAPAPAANAPKRRAGAAGAPAAQTPPRLPPLGTGSSAQGRALRIGSDRCGMPLYLPPEELSTVAVCGDDENELSLAFQALLESCAGLEDADVCVIDHPDGANRACAQAHGMRYCATAREANALVHDLFAEVRDTRLAIHNDYITGGGDRAAEAAYMLGRQRRIVVCVRDFPSLYGYLEPDALAELSTMAENAVAFHISFLSCGNQGTLSTYSGVSLCRSLIRAARFTIAVAPVNGMRLIDFPNLTAADRAIACSCANALLCSAAGRPTRFSLV